MTKVVEVPCPLCGTVVPVEITDRLMPAVDGGQADVVVADKFEAWSHDLVCPGSQEYR